MAVAVAGANAKMEAVKKGGFRRIGIGKAGEAACKAIEKPSDLPPNKYTLNVFTTL